MEGMELIRSRRSVRTFNGKELREDDAEKIRECAQHAENPYHIPVAWRLLNGEMEGLSSPVISGTNTWIAGKLAQVPHAEEAFGYSFEQIVLFAQSKGIGTTWIAGTMNRPAFERAMGLGPGEVMPCVSPLGYPAAKKSLREVMMRKGVKADSRMKFGELFFDGSFEKPLSPDHELSEPLEMVRWAPSAVNKQPWRVVIDGNKAHFYEKRSRGYVNASGWDLQKVDMGIAMFHFVYGLSTVGKQAEFALQDPGLAVPENVLYIASFLL